MKYEMSVSDMERVWRRSERATEFKKPFLSRSLDVETLKDLDLVRCISHESRNDLTNGLYPYFRGAERGNILMKTFNCLGVLAGFRQVPWDNHRPQVWSKMRSPAKHGDHSPCAGKVFWNEVNPLPGQDVFIFEGEGDTLVGYQFAGRDNAVYGVVQGAWNSAEMACRIPKECRVYLCVHWDQGGHDYAEKILPTLEGYDVWRYRGVSESDGWKLDLGNPERECFDFNELLIRGEIKSLDDVRALCVPSWITEGQKPKKKTSTREVKAREVKGVKSKSKTKAEYWIQRFNECLIDCQSGAFDGSRDSALKEFSALSKACSDLDSGLNEAHVKDAIMKAYVSGDAKKRKDRKQLVNDVFKNIT